MSRSSHQETRATLVAIERRSIPANSPVETQAFARNHVGEIDIALAHPLAGRSLTYQIRPTGTAGIGSNGRIAVRPSC